MADPSRLDSEQLSEQELVQLQALSADFEKRWRDCEDDQPAPSIEEFWNASEEPLRTALFRNLLKADVLARMKRGQSPAADDYGDRFADQGSTISRVFAELLPSSVTIVQDAFQKAASAASGPQLIKSIGDYEVLDRLGRGGMGVVYKALDPRLKRVVAIKMMLSAEHAGREEVARFRLEAEAVARLQHPNIVQIYEVGEHEDRPYISLEFVDGPDATTFVAGEPQPSRLAAEIVESLAAAMHYAHGQGVVHRDLKPANILIARPTDDEGSQSSSIRRSAVSQTGAGSTKNNQRSTAGENTAVANTSSESTANPEAPRESASVSLSGKSSVSRGAASTSSGWIAKITDFGLAKQLDTQSELTTSGAVVGTPQYMAPEQASGAIHDVGPLADVYSLGAILYFMVTGRPPFLGSSALETMMMVRNLNPPPPTMLIPQLSKDLETICLKCLEKDPARRYESAGALAAELGRFLRGEPILARPVGRLERGWRWSRRNPLAASLALACLVTFVLGFVGVTWKWKEASDNFATADAAKKLAVIKQGEAERSKEDAQRERNAALDAKLALQRQSSRLLFQRGLALCEKGKPDQGVLWMAESLKTAPAEEVDLPWRQVLRYNLSGWLQQVDQLDQRFTIKGSLRSLDFSRDSQQFVLGGQEGDLQRYNLSAEPLWEEASKIPVAAHGWDSTWALAHHPSEDWFFAGAGLRTTGENTGNGVLQRFDNRTGKPIGQPLEFPVAVNEIVFSPQGETYALVLADKTQSILSVHRTEDDSTLLAPLGGEPDGDRFHNLVFSRDGARFKYDRFRDYERIKTTVLDTANWKPTDEPPESLPFLTHWRERNRWDSVFHTPYLASSPDRKHALVAIEHQVGLRRRQQSTLNVKPVSETDELGQQSLSWHYFVDLSSDGKTVLHGFQNGTAILSNAESGNWICPPLHQSGRVLAVALSPEGDLAVTAANNAQIWNTRTGEAVGAALGVGAQISIVRFSPDGQTLAIGDYASRVTLWDVASQQLLHAPLPQRDIVTTLDFSPSGDRLLVGTASDWNRDPQAVLWDLKTQSPIGDPMRHVHYVRHVEFSPDGKRMLTASSDAKVRIWDANTAESIGATIPFTRETTPARFANHGKMIITGSSNGAIRGWNAETGEPIANAVFKGPALVSALEISEDGKRFVVGYRNGASRVFDTATFRPITPFTLQNGAIKKLGISANGSEWTAVTEDGQSRLWKVPAPFQGEAEEILKRLQVATGFRIDENQMQVEMSVQRWLELKQSLAADSALPSVSDADWHAAMALNAEQEGDWVEAQWWLERVIAARPADWDLHARIARTHSQLGDFKKADASYAEAAKLLESDASRSGKALKLWLRKRVAELIKDKHWSKAQWYLNRLLVEDPNDWRLLAQRAAVAQELGDLSLYKADRTLVLEQADDQAVLLGFLDDLVQESKWPEVASLYERSTLIGPISLTHWRQYSLALLETKQPDAFREACHKLVESLSARSLPGGVINELAWMCAMGPVDPEDAQLVVGLLEPLIEVDGASKQQRMAYANTLGGLYLRIKQPQQALERLNQSLKLQPGEGSFTDWALLALAHHQLGNKEQAQQWRAKAAEAELDNISDAWQRLESKLLRDELELVFASESGKKASHTKPQSHEEK